MAECGYLGIVQGLRCILLRVERFQDVGIIVL